MDQSKYQDSYNDRKRSSGDTGLDFSVLPPGKEVSFYAPAEGPGNRIQILEFAQSSPKSPRIAKGKDKPGELYYKLDVYMHRNIGPTKSTVVCLAQTYGKACPACELAEQVRASGDKKAYDNIKGKRICFYNVVDLNNPQKGVQIFKVSQPLFDFELMEEAKNAVEKGFVEFANIEDGWDIAFRAVPATTGTYNYNEFRGFRFTKRSTSLAHLVPKLFPLDQMLTVHSADEIQQIISGEFGESVVDPTVPALAPREEVPVPRRYAEDDETSTYSATPTRTVTAPPPEEVAAPSSPECPFGHVFGKDFDRYPDDCDKCDHIRPCLKAKPRL